MIENITRKGLESEARKPVVAGRAGTINRPLSYKPWVRVS